jgi:hypothetical protein
MTAHTTKLSERARQSLKKLVADKASPTDTEHVWVVVLGPDEALVRRSKVHGRNVTSRELQLRLAGAEIAVERLTTTPPTENLPQLTANEAALLDEAGLSEKQPEGLGALERSRIEFEILLRESVTLTDAAKLLGVSTGRLRQRLQQRSLYGMKERAAWRLPRFQFDPHKKGTLVRGIDKVLPHISPSAHPLAVEKWFSMPHPDLVIAIMGDDETRVTPLAWLSAGKPPEEVAELAREI